MNYLSLVLIGLLSGAAWAAEDVPVEGAIPAGEAASPAPEFMAVDADKSGGITVEEAVNVPGLTAAFKKVDRDANSEISKDEYADVISGKMPLGPTSGAQETIQ
ncbi:MAG: hypothetical protein ACREU9_03745 [Gammaproteobacteria bacterium]